MRTIHFQTIPRATLTCVAALISGQSTLVFFLPLFFWPRRSGHPRLTQTYFRHKLTLRYGLRVHLFSDVAEKTSQRTHTATIHTFFPIFKDRWILYVLQINNHGLSRLALTRFVRSLVQILCCARMQQPQNLSERTSKPFQCNCRDPRYEQGLGVDLQSPRK